MKQSNKYVQPPLPFYAGKSPSKTSRELPNPPPGYLSRIKETPFGRHCHCVCAVQDHSSETMCDYAKRLYNSPMREEVTFTAKPEIIDFVNTPLAGILSHLHGSIARRPKLSHRDYEGDDILDHYGEYEEGREGEMNEQQSFEVDDSKIEGLFAQMPDLTQSSIEASMRKSPEIAQDGNQHEEHSENTDQVQVQHDSSILSASGNTTRLDRLFQVSPSAIVRDSNMRQTAKITSEHEQTMSLISYNHKIMEIQALIRRMKRDYCMCDTKGKVWKRLRQYQTTYRTTAEISVDSSRLPKVANQSHEKISNVSYASSPGFRAKNSLLHTFEIEPSRRIFYQSLNKAITRLESE